MTSTPNIEPKYHAVLDPSDSTRMTYWRRCANGSTLMSWPAHSRYEPRLAKADVPADLLGIERAEWIHDWHQQHAAPWWRAIQAAVDDDPEGSAARFAAFMTHCLVCSRPLTEAASRVYGVGPECRRGAPAEVLAALADRMGRAHAEVLAACGAMAS